MKNTSWKIWHRCGTCGTIFSDLTELRGHLQVHKGSKRWAPGGAEQEPEDSPVAPANEQDLRSNPRRPIDLVRRNTWPN